ncbi:MAG: hypothetical protein A2Y38_20125 [Spirochaetes bacterium GWB1_59_5]|nr:MAG: hypothetical protein A2Y38_20125 [Spirochaetes bacterium GWB1_59_5]
MPLSGTKGYLDPLLSGMAVDYAATMNRGIIGRALFPIAEVDRDDGKYPFFGKENFSVPDDNINSNEGEARRSDLSGELKEIHCVPHALKEGIDVRKNRQMDGPFKLKERDAVKRLTYKLLVQEERRIAAVISAHTNGQALAGAGELATNQWNASGGDPFAVAASARTNLWFTPNTLALSYDVYLALKSHAKVLAKLGVNSTQIVTMALLAEMFEVENVIVSEAQWAGPRQKADKSVSMTRIWNKLAAFAYVSTEDQVPTAGRVFLEKAPGMDVAGFAARTWHDPDKGVEGTDMVQVSLVGDERIVAPDCLYVIKSVLA